ncbi:MBL fold metallo-hydrolase [Spiractinospora alimapuensis]|uniref:MBL fold metallo-hydrolase n=1 Tax=Spiractinospora alimapuensis TaxID=2820884 RepID=UPI002ED6C780|nr:MBL fold metallo-hydrolase [Spiractinospora alimapuensis]
MFWKRKGKKKEGAAEQEATSATEAETPEDAEDVDGAADADDAAADERPDVKVECVETSGTFEYHGEEFEVTNNTWIVPIDDEGVIVVDPAHDGKAILDAVGEREVYLVACTNGYPPHIDAAVEVAERDEAPVALHRRELRSWRKVHGIEHAVEMEVEGGGAFDIGDVNVQVLALPGTSTGSVAYYIADFGLVLSGDTLLKGELGTVGGEFVDYTQQLASVGEVLLELPRSTRVLPDRGEETTIGAEADNFDDWVAGH